MRALATFELTKDYASGFWRKRPYRALDRLTLDVGEGEVFGFLGPNGAGKTTTLKLLMQLVFPTSGHAEILGRPLGDLATKRRIGYLPEHPYFYDYLTAEELLTYFASLFGYRGVERRTRAARLLDEVGIGAERRLQLRKFSKGMLQRVGIAQALVNDPDLVILDEPMSGLDPLGRREVRTLILRLRDEGRTVFFSSHVLSDAEALCSRVAILAHGRLVASGRLSEMLAFQVRGWELVMADLSDSAVSALGPCVQRVVRVGEGRYALELPLDPPPQHLVTQLTATGGRLMSLNPLRETLEDFFVKRVGAAETDAPGTRHPALSTRHPAPGTQHHTPHPAPRTAHRAPRTSHRCVAAIALNVFRESVRDKVPYNLVLFAIVLMAASYLLGQLTAGQDVKIIKDLGLAATSVFGLFIAVFIGIGLVSKEVERRSVYSLLAKPIDRCQMVAGKYAGLSLTLVVNVAIMAAALYAVLAYMAWGVSLDVQKAWDAPALDPSMLKALALILVELMVVTAIALFFSTFSTPILSAALTFGLFIVGHFSTDLRNFEQVVDSRVAATLARGLYWILPNLAQFDVTSQVVHAQPVPLGYMALVGAYGALYVAVLLVAAMVVFSRRDFK
jgi:ABC-2 type transport system ATP-binding protein